MREHPSAVKLKDLLSIEQNVVQKSIWILDSAELSFEISVTDFFEVMLRNVSRGIEHKWILPEGIVSRDYWHRLQDVVKDKMQNPEGLDRLQARFFPPEVMNLMSDFVIYDAKSMVRSCYVGILQEGEYWHFKTDEQKLAQLAAGFEFLWRLPRELHATISVYAAGKDELAYFLPTGFLPSDITQSINENYQEATRVYRAGCNTATISLCGRLIETVLHAIYEKLEDKVPEKGWGLDALANRIKKHGIILPALTEQFSLITKFRNRAVHGGVSFPNEEQANAVLLLTRDLLMQIFKQVSMLENKPSLVSQSVASIREEA